ncbi:unnamed protein product [Prunus armeniaca]|uniref:Uncharacterized protein n=1 Tax=Prunus armeniaca TaxID=36596 RepID=A0A6J5XPL8_PRUAR|nr:unnamed protein product [Prunus armeniaca]
MGGVWWLNLAHDAWVSSSCWRSRARASSSSNASAWELKLSLEQNFARAPLLQHKFLTSFFLALFAEQAM